MGEDLEMDLKNFVSWARATDKETHEKGKDLQRDTMYDVDWVNLKRILTGREAANIYESLENHNNLILTSGPLECQPLELVSLDNGRRYVPAGEVFDIGYKVYLATSIPTGVEKERIITFAKRQLPTDDYKKLFEEFLKSEINLKRAKDNLVRQVSQFDSKLAVV